MNRHVVWLVVFAVVALALGSALASIPSPQDTATFWVGNYSSPWAVLAFTAGWAQAKVRWAVITAVATEIACVVGFYGRFLILDMTNPTALGLPRETSSTTLLIAGLGSWVAFAGPWLIAGVGAGMIYGAIGAWWARSHPWLAGALVSLPFFIEPLAWRAYLGYEKGPIVVWLGEAATGAAVLIWAIRTSGPSRRQRQNGTPV